MPAALHWWPASLRQPCSHTHHMHAAGEQQTSGSGAPACRRAHTSTATQQNVQALAVPARPSTASEGVGPVIAQQPRVWPSLPHSCPTAHVHWTSSTTACLCRMRCDIQRSVPGFMVTSGNGKRSSVLFDAGVLATQSERAGRRAAVRCCAG